MAALGVSGPGKRRRRGPARGVGGLGKVDEAAGRGGAGDKRGPDFLHQQLPYMGSVKLHTSSVLLTCCVFMDDSIKVRKCPNMS